MEQVLRKGNPTPPPASGSLQVENEKLKTLLATRDAENEVLKEKIGRLEGELVWEIGASGDMVLEMVKMKELLQEKEVENQGLKQALQKERIQNVLRTAEIRAQEEKVMTLFPDVLKIVIGKEREAYRYFEWWKALLPLMLSNCRLVCKSWKQSVDAIMQEETSRIDLFKRYFSSSLAPYPLNLSYQKYDKLRWNDNLQIISRELRTHSDYNPIPSRHLMLELFIKHDAQNWNEFSQMVIRYLQVLGKHAWVLTLSFSFKGFDNEFQDGIVLSQYLPEWLSLVPNVKSLLLCSLSFGHRQEVDTQMDFGSVSFPKLKHLTTLQFFGNTTLMSYHILKNNRHISKLVLSSEPSSAVHPLPSSNVTEIDLPNLSTFSCFLKHPDDWKVLGAVTWKLESLSLDCDCDGFCSATGNQFVEGVERFGNTLKSLTFNLSIIGTGNPEEVKLKLPFLKQLRIEVTEWEPEPLGSILESLESMETFYLDLHVSLSGKRLDYPLWDVQEVFYDYVNDVYEMVDWMKLPNLKSVKVTAKVHGDEIGYRNVFVLKRPGMSSLRFDIIKIDESEYKWVSEDESELNFSSSVSS